MRREADLISNTDRPLTRRVLRDGLVEIGLAPGDLVLMHVALSRLGWVVGSVQSVLEAVTDVLGPDGTLAMPGFSSYLSDPASWTAPPVPDSWVPVIRDNMPLYDPDRSPTRGIGRVAEAFRAWPGCQRSHHPRDSFLARGPLADSILAQHSLDDALGQDSPLGALHRHDAKVLLLGAGFDSCTSFHLAEPDLPGIDRVSESYPAAQKNGVTIWKDSLQPPTFEEHFASIGAEFAASGAAIATGFDGAARLFRMRYGVAFARDWLVRAALAGRLA